MANNEQTGQARDSEVQEIKLLNEKYNPKVPKFQIGDSRISTDNLVQGLHAKMKINIESLHKAINAIKEVQKRSRKES